MMKHTNIFFRAIYKGPLWLSREVTRTIVNAGFAMLDSFLNMVYKTHAALQGACLRLKRAQTMLAS